MTRQFHIIAAALFFAATTVPSAASTPVTIIVPLEFKSLDAAIVSARVACATFADPLTPAESANKSSLTEAFKNKAGRAEFPPGNAPIVNGKAVPPTITFSYRVATANRIPSSFICAISAFTRKDGTEVGANGKPLAPGSPYISIVGGLFPPPKSSPTASQAPAGRAG